MNLPNKGRFPAPIKPPGIPLSSAMAAARQSLLLLLLLGATARGAESGLPAASLPVATTNLAAINSGRFYTWAEIRRTIDRWKREHPQLIHEKSLGKTAEGRDMWPPVRSCRKSAGSKLRQDE